MKLHRYLLLFFVLASFNTYAIPVIVEPVAPMVDKRLEQEDLTAITDYIAQLKSFIYQIADTSNIENQLSNLNKLISTQNNLRNVCNVRCSTADKIKIANYIDSINDNILDKFNAYSGNVANNSSNMKELATTLAISSADANTKSVGLSLQKASQVTLTQINNMLQQIQELLVLNNQKQQMENKMEKANNDAIYSGFAKSGL